VSFKGLHCLFLPLLECLLAGGMLHGSGLEAQFLCREEKEKTK